MMHRRLVVMPLVIGLVSLACSLFSPTVVPGRPTATAGGAAATTSPGPYPVASTNTPEPAPDVTATAPPSPSPEAPVDTPSPAPASLNPSGPYVILSDASGVWVTNPDGSALTQLLDVEVHGDLRHAISPQGDRLALVVRTEDELDLVIVRVPSGEKEMTIRLIALTVDDEIAQPDSAAAFALYAMRDYPSVAWQPGDARWLAFIGALGGPTADLYLYDTQTQDITRLTDGPSQAVLPEWSPDGQYILHAGVSWVPPFGGAILGPNQLDGVWAVRAADGAVIEQPRPAGVRPNLVGWQDAGHYWIFDSDDDCFAQNLRVVDIASGTAAPGLDFSFYYAVAQAPRHGALLLAGAAAGCPTALGEGVFLLRSGETTPTRLLDQRAYEISWLPESGVFVAYPEGLVSGDGRTLYAPPVADGSYNAAVSRAGYEAWQVLESQAGRVVVRAPGGDWQTIMDGFVSNLLWDPLDGQTLLIAGQDGSLHAATAPDFVPRLMGYLGGHGARLAWAPQP